MLCRKPFSLCTILIKVDKLSKELKNEVFFDLESYQDNEGNEKKLTVTVNSSVQPAVLLRLGVFVPSTRSIPKGSEGVVDVSTAFSKLEYARKEGYDQVKIYGQRLSISTDFSVWMGVIGAFSTYGFDSNIITIPFQEFAKICQYDSRQLNKRLRDRVFESLTKIGTKTVQFKNKESGKKTFTHLLKKAEYDPDTDSVTLEADPDLWELYQIDYSILFRKKPYHLLKGKEVAQTIYAFISSLPDNPAPIGFSRIIERLSLTSPIKEQNRMIKSALNKLQEIGYINYSLSKKGSETFVLIHTRNKKLQAVE